MIESDVLGGNMVDVSKRQISTAKLCDLTVVTHAAYRSGSLPPA
jgi:hypothetical protein